MGAALALAGSMGVPAPIAAQLLTYFVTGLRAGLAERANDEDKG